MYEGVDSWAAACVRMRKVWLELSSERAKAG